MTAERAVWEQLVSVAVVGTERRPLPPDVVERVGALVETPVRRPSDEASILTAAGALAAYRRSGLRPPAAAAADGAVTRPPAAGADDGPEASAQATGLLELLLEGHAKVPGGPNGLVIQWLERCAATGRRPQPRMLPALLDHATRQRDLRAAVVAAGGPRLAWLAARNPAWNWVEAVLPALSQTSFAERGQNDEELWQTGDHSARMARLVAVRAADPPAALALVQGTWSGEKARDRAEILDALRPHLGPADEAFLDQALDDRAAAVRNAAADMLAGLTTSALAGRMTDRLRPLVTVSGRRKKRIDAALPEQPDAAARRDGVRDDGAPPTIGLRTWWLVQLVQATPLGFWTDELGLLPEDAVRSAAVHQPELRTGWTTAARRQHDARWARALMQTRPEPALQRAMAAQEARPDPALVRALAAEDAWPVAEAALPSATDGMVPGLLNAVPAPWPPTLSHAALVRLRASKNSVATEQGLVILATAADASVVPELERWQAEAGKHDRLRHQLRSVLHAISIRQTILQEFP